MAKISLRGTDINTSGDLPSVGSQAPDFLVTKTDMSDISLADLKGKRVLLNIFPSIDTAVCAASVRRFNMEAGSMNGVVVLCISADLPFAHARFCGAEGLEDVVSLSTFRSPAFGRDYGVTIATSGLRGLLSRAVVVVDSSGDIAYTQQVPEIAQEPDYEAALNALGNL